MAQSSGRSLGVHRLQVDIHANEEIRQPATDMYLKCALCGGAFSPGKAEPGKPACCPACRNPERNMAIDYCVPTLIREKTMQRKTRESMDAVARRLKGT